MNLIFENQSTATYHYPPSNVEPLVAVYEGRKYQAVGESYAPEISLGRKFIHLLVVIGFLAAGILLLCIPFFFRSYREKIDSLQKQPDNIHYIPLQPRLWQKFALSSDVGLVYNLKQHFDPPFDLPDSVACCIRVTFEGGEVKKQFIFDKPTLKSVIDASEKIEQLFTKSLQEEINLETKYIINDYVILSKAKDGIITTSSRNERWSLKLLREIGPVERKVFENVQTIDALILEELGFAGECVDSSGNFIEGKYFQKVPSLVEL